MCSFVTRHRDPARRRRRVLCLGRAARRSALCAAAPRSSGGGVVMAASYEARAYGVRGGDGGSAGATAVSPRRRRRAPILGLRRGEQGGVRRLPPNRAGRRGAVDGGGVPRRPGDAADLGFSIRDRRAAAARGVAAGRLARHRRRSEHEIDREDGESRREARRSAGGAGRPRAGFPATRSAWRGCGEWARPRPRGSTTAES